MLQDSGLVLGVFISGCTPNLSYDLLIIQNPSLFGLTFPNRPGPSPQPGPAYQQEYPRQAGPPWPRGIPQEEKSVNIQQTFCTAAYTKEGVFQIWFGSFLT